jgi:hypothetical protein
VTEVSPATLHYKRKNANTCQAHNLKVEIDVWTKVRSLSSGGLRTSSRMPRSNSVVCRHRLSEAERGLPPCSGNTDTLIQRLPPALSATRAVVKRVAPSFAKTRIAASRMAATSSVERACLGCFLEENWPFRRSVMVVAENANSEPDELVAFYSNLDESTFKPETDMTTPTATLCINTLNTAPLAPLRSLVRRSRCGVAGDKPRDGPSLRRAGSNDAEQDRYLNFWGRLKDFPLAVSRETGVLLYMLARSCHARTIVEFGTSFGVSTLHRAAALRDNGGGRLTTTEFELSKVARARENLAV